MVVLVGLAHMCFADREDSWAQRTFKFHGGVPAEVATRLNVGL